MLKKEERVKSKEDFQLVISKKSKKFSDCFIIYSLKREEYNYPRFGISASKKLGDAVKRVKIRRQVRAMIHQIKSNSYIKPKDYVIIVRSKFLNNNYETNLQTLKKLIMEDN